MTPAVPKVSTRTVNVEALIRNPCGEIWWRCVGGASFKAGRVASGVTSEAADDAPFAPLFGNS
jgi:hypothetical protein